MKRDEKATVRVGCVTQPLQADDSHTIPLES